MESACLALCRCELQAPVSGPALLIADLSFSPSWLFHIHWFLLSVRASTGFNPSSRISIWRLPSLPLRIVTLIDGGGVSSKSHSIGKPTNGLSYSAKTLMLTKPEGVEGYGLAPLKRGRINSQFAPLTSSIYYFADFLLYLHFFRQRHSTPLKSFYEYSSRREAGGRPSPAASSGLFPLSILAGSPTRFSNAPIVTALPVIYNQLEFVALYETWHYHTSQRPWQETGRRCNIGRRQACG